MAHIVVVSHDKFVPLYTVPTQETEGESYRVEHQIDYLGILFINDTTIDIELDIESVLFIYTKL